MRRHKKTRILADIYLWEHVKMFDPSDVWELCAYHRVLSLMEKKLFQLTRHIGRMENRKVGVGVGVGRPRPIMTAGTQQRQQQVILISCKWGGILNHANEVSWESNPCLLILIFLWMHICARGEGWRRWRGTIINRCHPLVQLRPVGNDEGH